jgi:hypothetical protein
MAKIVWIASYPRSGNTWMRFLLANLLYGRVESSVRLQELVPDIHRGVSGGQIHGNRKTLIKTHWRFLPDLPLREDTIGVIHIFRHPLDVLVSNLNYVMLRGNLPARLTNEEARQAFERRWIDDYIAAGGYARWREMGFGSWEENVRSWTEDALPYPRLVLRYEDMRADIAGTVAKVIRFLGIEADGPTVAAAIERSSFEAMRALEEEEIAEARPGIFFDPSQRASLAAGLRFVRGAGRDPLSPAQRQRALERFAALMARLGYRAETTP